MTKNIEARNPYLTLVGTHGLPEIVGITLAASAETDPVAGWDIEIANEQVLGTGKRFIDDNLAMAFGDADPLSSSYERRRAAQILNITLGRVAVLDIHDTLLDTGEYVQVHHTRTSARILGAAALLGVNKVVVVTHEKSILGHNPNSMVVEFGRQDGIGGSSVVEKNVRRLRQCMEDIARYGLPTAPLDEFEYFERVAELTNYDAERRDITTIADFQPFATELPGNVHQALDLPSGDYVADYWNAERPQDCPD